MKARIFGLALVLLAGVACAAAKPAKKPTRPAKITSATTYYDRKEGVAIFNGRVHVDDAEYQLHADKAFVFMNGTNDLEKIVAVGHVALTNENKRAYGVKASYYRNHRMVVLHGEPGKPAEVREVQKDGDRVVHGRKIKFWVNSEQVEVVESDITAPRGGLGNSEFKQLR